MSPFGVVDGFYGLSYDRRLGDAGVKLIAVFFIQPPFKVKQFLSLTQINYMRNPAVLPLPFQELFDFVFGQISQAQFSVNNSVKTAIPKILVGIVGPAGAGVFSAGCLIIFEQ